MIPKQDDTVVPQPGEFQADWSDTSSHASPNFNSNINPNPGGSESDCSTPYGHVAEGTPLLSPSLGADLIRVD